MKNNAETAAALIRMAISETGGDFALSDARRLMHAALNELQHAHKKREKREIARKILEEKEKEKKKMRFEDAKNRMKMLDQMLQEEKTKLQNGLN